jgi:hypothetical protein
LISENTKTNKTKNKRKRRFNSLTIKAALFTIKRRRKVYREEDVRMAMQIAAAILIICFIVSRF